MISIGLMYIEAYLEFNQTSMVELLCENHKKPHHRCLTGF